VAEPTPWMCSGGKGGEGPHPEVENYGSTCTICSQPQGAAKASGAGPNVPAILGAVLLLGLLGGGGYWFLNREKTTSVPPLEPVTIPQPPIEPEKEPLPAAATFVPPVFYTTIKEVPDVPKGIINYGGSTTFAPLRNPIIEKAIAQYHPGFTLRYTEPPRSDSSGEKSSGLKPGSGAGIEMLLDKQLSFAQSSRPLKLSEYEKAQKMGFTVYQVAVAIDGIALYIHPDIKVAGLTLEQVKQIFTGQITNWQDLGGSNLPIKLFIRNLKDGGTVEFFSKELLDEVPFPTDATEVRDTTDGIRKVSQTPGGIGFATAAEVVNQETVASMPLAKVGSNFISPGNGSGQVNKAAFADGSYPITRRLFIIIRRENLDNLKNSLDEQAGLAYANMLLSTEGQRWIEQENFVPIRTP